MHDLIPLNSNLPIALSQDDLDGIDYFRGKEKSEATRIAYPADWKHFMAWC